MQNLEMKSLQCNVTVLRKLNAANGQMLQSGDSDNGTLCIVCAILVSDLS